MITLPKKNQRRWSTFLSMNSIWVYMSLKGLIGVQWGAYVGGYDVHTAMRRSVTGSVSRTSQNDCVAMIS